MEADILNYLVKGDPIKSLGNNKNPLTNFIRPEELSVK